MKRVQSSLIKEHFRGKKPLLHLAKKLGRDYSLLWREKQSLIKKCVALSKQLERFDLPINVVMGMMELTMHLTKRHRDIVHSIVLFGSYVRGDYTSSSDVDVALVVEREIPELRRVESSLSRKYGANFSLMQFTPERFEELLRGEAVLLINMSTDGVAFYDDGTFRRNMITKPSAKTIRSCIEHARERYSKLKRSITTLKSDESVQEFVSDFGYLIGLQLSQALLLMKGVIPRSKYLVFVELGRHYPELGNDAKLLARCMQKWDGHQIKLPNKDLILATLEKLMGLCESGISKIGVEEA
jgi:predicted nucleotidyltransferase